MLAQVTKKFPFLTSRTAKTVVIVAAVSPTPILMAMAAAGMLHISAPAVNEDEGQVTVAPFEEPRLIDIKLSNRVIEGKGLNCAVPRNDDLECMACNVYHEARGEPTGGQINVAKVTMNRAKASGKSVCETVFARKQFSWTWDSKLNKKITDVGAWERAVEVSKLVMREYRDDDVVILVKGKANRDIKWYHADYVAPKWKDDYDTKDKVGAHIFYAPAATKKIKVVAKIEQPKMLKTVAKAVKAKK